MDDRRLYGLDALRGIMMMLGILLHAAGFYLSDPPVTLPLPGDDGGAFGFDLVFHLIHSFRIPAFFVLAGMFAALLVDRRGMAGAFRNRVARVLLPLLLGIVTVVPVAGLFMLNFILSVRYGTHAMLPDAGQLRAYGQELQAAGIPTDQLSFGHLWFLYYLCLFYLSVPILHFLAGAVRRLAPALVVSLAALSAAALWQFRGGQVLEGFIFIKPHAPSLVFYGAFFVAGYFVNFHRAFLHTAGRLAPKLSLAPLALFPLAMWLTHLDMQAGGNTGAIHGLAVFVNALNTWTLVYLCIGIAMRYFDSGAAWVLYISRSAYWVFLLHLPVAAVTAWWLVQFELSIVVKFALVVGVTTVACFSSYHYLVQRSWISVLLNGRRFDMAWPWCPGGEPARQ